MLFLCMIHGSQLEKRYEMKSDTVYALKGVDVSIEKGEFVAIVGTSGSGKSTLLQLLGGLDKPSSGDIEVDGTDLKKMNDAELSAFRNATMGFIFQAFYLQSFLSLQQNVEVPMMFGTKSASERAAAAVKAIEAVGLKDRLTHKPSELSGGQQQRVAIARAIAHEPKILFADEPTGNLDKKTTTDVLELLQQLNKERGMTLVLVTHDEEVAGMADRVIRLEDGEVVSV